MKIALLTTDSREHFRDYQNPRPSFGTAPEALLQGLSGVPGAEVHVISCVQQPVVSPGNLAPNIFYHAVVVPKSGWLRTGYSGCVRATRECLRRLRPDIVHGQGTERDCALSAVFSGFPNVLTLHGNMRLVARVNRARMFSFLWLAARIERFTLPRTAGVVCITNYTRAAVAGLARRTWLLPNAVDAGFFAIHHQPAGNPPAGICVGAICPRKNQNAFIRALDSLARQAAFKIVFLGQTDQSAYSREFLALVKARPWCEYHGFAGRDRLKEVFASAAFAVLPTLEDNCPMVVIEAMAAGVPVLASKVGGVPDLIVPEVTGLFCNPAEPATFAVGVRRLLEEPGLAARLSAAARQDALNRFHPAVVARRHVEIYQEILAAGRSGRRA